MRPERFSMANEWVVTHTEFTVFEPWKSRALADAMPLRAGR